MKKQTIIPIFALFIATSIIIIYTFAIEGNPTAQWNGTKYLSVFEVDDAIIGHNLEVKNNIFTRKNVSVGETILFEENATFKIQTIIGGNPNINQEANIVTQNNIMSIEPIIFGEIFMENNSVETIINSTQEYSFIQGITELNPDSNFFTMPKNNTLQYAGISQKLCFISQNMNLKSTKPNSMGQTGSFKNNNRIKGTKVKTALDKAGDEQSISINNVAILSPGDIISSFIANPKGNDNIIVTDMNILIVCHSIGKD
mgnify:CR=1 FL=1